MAWRRGQAYSQDLRDRVLAADDLSAREAAERFGVSPSYVVKVRQRRDHKGDVTPGPQRSWTPRKLAAQHAAIAAQVRARPDATLAELCAWLLAEFGVSASLSTMWNTVRHRRAGTRRYWPKRAACGALQGQLDGRRLVFLDETWTKTNMARGYGRAPRGQRAIGHVPYGHWQTTTFLAGLRHDRVVAPLVLDGATDGVTFLAWSSSSSRPRCFPVTW